MTFNSGLRRGVKLVQLPLAIGVAAGRITAFAGERNHESFFGMEMAANAVEPYRVWVRGQYPNEYSGLFSTDDAMMYATQEQRARHAEHVAEYTASE